MKSIKNINKYLQFYFNYDIKEPHRKEWQICNLPFTWDNVALTSRQLFQNGIELNIMKKNNLNPKKLPSQKRSKETIQHILDTTIQILEDSGIEGLTTNHIAKKANINVASIYQYFPNKYAILYEIYLRWLDWVMVKLDEIEQNYFMVLDWPEFFEKLNIEILEDTLYSYQAEFQISKAIQISRDLKEINDKHFKEVGERVAKFLKGYGSKWDEEKTRKLALFIVSMPDLIYHMSAPTREDRKLRIEWMSKMTNSLLKECFK